MSSAASPGEGSDAMAQEHQTPRTAMVAGLRKEFGTDQWPTGPGKAAADVLIEHQVTPGQVGKLSEDHLKEMGIPLGQRLRFKKPR